MLPSRDFSRVSTAESTERSESSKLLHSSTTQRLPSRDFSRVSTAESTERSESSKLLHKSTTQCFRDEIRQRLEKLNTQQGSVLEQRTRLVNDDPSLLRGVPLTRVVSRFGYLLSPEGTVTAGAGVESREDTFQLSVEVKALDHFISHSWRDNAKLKWLTLLWTRNFLIAIVGANLMYAVLILLSLEWPEFRARRGVNISFGEFDMGWSSVSWPVTFLLLILFGHNCQTEKMLFLDKACIHQTDAELKTAGIHSLGAFLKNSHELLVLWGDDYFDRIWCCYELATYVLIHDTARVNIIPLENAMLGIAIACCSLIFNGSSLVTLTFCSSENCDMILNTVCFPLPFFLVGVYKAKSYAARERLKERLSEFEIRNCHCFCCQVNHKLQDGQEIPCDREFVQESIQAWYGSQEQDGLDQFNKIAREDLLESTLVLLGPATISSFRIMLLISNTVCLFQIEAAILNMSSHPQTGILMLMTAIHPIAWVLLADQFTGTAILEFHKRCGVKYLQLVGGVVFLCAIELTNILNYLSYLPLWVSFVVAAAVSALVVLWRNHAK